MDTPIRVLIVEDSEEDALLVERELKRGGFAPTCVRVDTAEVMRQALEGAKWDVIIADYSFPRFSGLAAFQLYKEAGLDVPFIIVSGSIGEDIAVVAMKAGVHDYVLKGNLIRLVPAIQRELREVAERSARRRAEEKLKQTERLRMIGELTSSLIHDLKNPLQSIMSSGEILSADDVRPEQKAKFGTMIDRQVQRVLAMSEEVLEFVRGDLHLTLKEVNLVEIAQEIVDTYAPGFAEAGVTLTCAGTAGAGRTTTIVADEQKIWRALQNLISNAKDAMPDGGQVTLRVITAGEQVVMEVTDTGKGIPKPIRKSLFQPFVSYGKKRGTGLGLPIVKSIVDAHGGSVTFTVKEDVGTTFQIRLPKQPVQSRQHESREAMGVL